MDKIVVYKLNGVITGYLGVHKVEGELSWYAVRVDSIDEAYTFLNLFWVLDDFNRITSVFEQHLREGENYEVINK